MENTKEKLLSLLKEGQSYKSNMLPKNTLGYLEEHPIEFEAWVKRVNMLISRLFTNDSPQYFILKDGVNSYEDLRDHRTPNAYDNTNKKLLKALEMAIESIDDDKYDEIFFQRNNQSDLKNSHASNKIFIVHGHDEKIKVELARFLEKIGLEAIILHEQPNKGKTIIEKFEDYSEVNFAIILLTPDDVGAEINETENLQHRARQNVIFEFGFFIGKLKRQNVCALYKEGVELPSDYEGVIYIPLDDASGWKLQVARELRASGIKINLENII